MTDITVLFDLGHNCREIAEMTGGKWWTIRRRLLAAGRDTGGPKPLEFYKANSFPSGDCWLWKGYVMPNGYGRYGRGYTHRKVYEIAHGPIPKGMTVDHTCHCRSCVNPAHLQLLTHSSNSVKKRRGAFKAECELRRFLGLPVSAVLP